MVFFILLIALSSVVAIQNGVRVTDQNKYPYYVMIGNPHVCGGTLLSYDPAYILTAAHCVDAPVHPTSYVRDKNPYFALYNNIHRTHQKATAIVDWTIHPLYNISGNIDIRYDAAVVKLASPLMPSKRIKRVPFWTPAIASKPPTQAEMIGFGYTDIEGQLAQDLQILPLNITKFDSVGKEYLESKSSTEPHIACHGDSGGPLVVYYPTVNPRTNETLDMPYVLGDLTRIFGARDVSPDILTCPVAIASALHDNSTQNTVSQVFTNNIALIDWISNVTEIAVEDLRDPFYEPPFDYSEGEEEDPHGELHPAWRIGVVVENNGLLDTKEAQHFWIGALMKNLLALREDTESSISTTLSYSKHFLSFCIIVTIILVLF